MNINGVPKKEHLLVARLRDFVENDRTDTVAIGRRYPKSRQNHNFGTDRSLLYKKRVECFKIRFGRKT